MSTCPHDPETYAKTPGCPAKNHCHECRNRICLRCRNLDGSWMSGLCDDCYRISEQEQREREADWAEEARRQERERIWREGWEHYRKHFSPNDPEFGLNPYKAAS